MPADADRRLARRCARSHGVFAVTDALACGVPERVIGDRLRTGRYERMLPGVLRVAGVPDGVEARYLAAVLYVAGEAVLARSSAGHLWGLTERPDDDRVHVVVRDRTFDLIDDRLCVHRTAYWLHRHLTSRRGIPVTTPARTLCDLAGQMPVWELRRLVGRAVRGRLTSADELRHCLRHLGRFRGKRALRTVVNELSPLDPMARSELESLFLRVARSGGVPPTAINHRVVDAHGRTRLIDAVYLPERVPIELDSRMAHGTLLDWHDDLRRENAVTLAGWRDFLRYSWWDLTQRPGGVVTEIRRALEAAR